MPSMRFAPLAFILFALAGCGGPEQSAPPPNTAAPSTAAQNSPPPAATKPLKVGLITNGSLTDSGWNALAGKGVEEIKTQLGAKTGHQSADKPAAEEALRGFATDGYNLIFAHGAEFGDAAKRVAADFPDSTFVVSSGEVQGPNVASLRFDLGEASFLAGMAAAGVSKSGKAGQIGGEDFPPVKQAFELFERGGKAVNPKFSAPITYLGNWSDANAAKEKALAMIRSGADVLFQNADAAGEGVFRAAEESKGVLVVGSNANQNDLKPELIVASAVLDVPKTFLSVARDVQGGTFKGRVYREDLASGNVDLVINPKLEDRIPTDVQKRIAQARLQIKMGKLKLVTK